MFFLVLVWSGWNLSSLGARVVDSVELHFTDFMRDVATHHPLAWAAHLEVAIGDARMTMARGAFDPHLGFGLNRKDFSDQTYYQLLGGELHVATSFGLEVATSYERNQGTFLNNQNRLPADGLWNLEFKMPLGQGLSIDRRRAELKKARLYQEASIEIQSLLLNELLLDAGKSYWSWFETYHTLDVNREAHRLAVERFDAVKESARQGDVAHIDTVEAKIQVQRRSVALRQAMLDFETARNTLSVFLWREGVAALELLPTTIPPSTSSIQLDPIDAGAMDSLSVRHPDLRIRLLETRQLEVARRLKQEMLKPTLDLRFKPLAETVAGLTDVGSGDYVLGLNFGIPLFLRKERGALAVARADLDQAKLDLSFQEASLENSSKNWYMKNLNTLDQIEMVQEMVTNYFRLLQGEQELFRNGESSLFLLNSRELNFISAQTKLLSLLADSQTSRLAYNFYTGQLYKMYLPQGNQEY